MSDTKLCPYCSEEIKAAAIKCKHCGERLDLSSPPSPGEAPATQAPVGYPIPPTQAVGAATALGEAPPGTKLGNFVLGRLLGTGGMGSVYEAHHERLGQPVAIKVLAPNLAQDPELISRFEQEARVQANLRHSGIVSVTDFIVDGGLCAFVMELVEGKTLADVIREHGGPLTPERCKELLVPVLDALEFAHERGIVHRDIKPSNIMVASEGGGEVVKVMDFGIAKAMGGARRTATGAMMGTLHYMSPEQCEGAKNVDARSDLYSIGVTLYEMATGRVPFDLDSEYKMMTAHIQNEPPPPSQLHPGISQTLEKVILKALTKSRDDRFQSAGELKSALTRGSPGKARPVAPTPQVKPAALPQTQRNETPAPSARPAPVYSAQPDRTPTSRIPLFAACAAALIFGVVVVYLLATRNGSDDASEMAHSASPSEGYEQARPEERPSPEPVHTPSPPEPAYEPPPPRRPDPPPAPPPPEPPPVKRASPESHLPETLSRSVYTEYIVNNVVDRMNRCCTAPMSFRARATINNRGRVTKCNVYLLSDPRRVCDGRRGCHCKMFCIEKAISSITFPRFRQNEVDISRVFDRRGSGIVPR